MDQLAIYVGLFTIIVITCQVFSRSKLPFSLILVITGMLLSILPNMPQIQLNPDVVLNIFLPVLIYQISAFSSWKDIKKSLNPIISLSMGHVIFITVLVAVVIHTLIPEMGWALAFVLGAVISPPDDVAIVTIAEKIRMPARIVTILEGEGMLNDATALILFRFALAAVITHQFAPFRALGTFFLVVGGETLYGLAVGYATGWMRMKIRDPVIHTMASVLTPFLAYLPAEHMGGCGVIATVVAGFVIGNVYSVKFTPEFRLISRAIWPMLAFAMQSILFLLVGMDMQSILNNISSIPFATLLLYSSCVIAAVILGRFVWVFGSRYAQLLLPIKQTVIPRWQFLFVVSWAGMRGGISLAAALAVPNLPLSIAGANARDLLLFLIFMVIVATFLIQGLTLPWLIKLLGIQKYGQREKYNEHLSELDARLKIIKAVLRWLKEYKKHIANDVKLLEQAKLYTREYQMLKKNLAEQIGEHHSEDDHDEQLEQQSAVFLLAQIIEVEKNVLLRLFREEKINLAVSNKLLEQLDHRSKFLHA
jgi:Na+/H+ antiporter